MSHTPHDLWKLVRATEFLEEPPPNEEPASDPTPAGGSQAARLMALADEAGVELFHSPRGDAFAYVSVANHREVWPLRSKAFLGWLTREVWRRLGKALPPATLESALRVLAAKAVFDGPQEEVHVRAAWHGHDLYYDLADPEWRAVKVTSTGWEVVPAPPVRFRRYPAMSFQPLPKPGGAIDQLWRFINVPAARDRRLIVAWLVTGLVPDIPRPLLALHGDQGGGKTTAARILASLIDPSSAPLVRARDEAELVQGLAHHYVAILDNVSYLTEWLSDLLSRAVTGEGFTKRQLYTDEEDVTFAFRRLIILTGINLVVTKPDLLDRALIINVDRVSDGARIEDRRLVEQFGAAHPHLFGVLLDLLVNALREYPNTTLTTLPRMADFARWGAAIAQGQGRGAASFLADYAVNVERQNEEAISNSLTATLLLMMLHHRDSWEGTVLSLLVELHDHAGLQEVYTAARKLPSTPQALGRELRQLRPNLAALGWEVTFGKSHHPRTVTIARKAGQ